MKALVYGIAVAVIVFVLLMISWKISQPPVYYITYQVLMKEGNAYSVGSLFHTGYLSKRSIKDMQEWVQLTRPDTAGNAVILNAIKIKP